MRMKDDFYSVSSQCIYCSLRRSRFKWTKWTLIWQCGIGVRFWRANGDVQAHAMRTKEDDRTIGVIVCEVVGTGYSHRPCHTARQSDGHNYLLLQFCLHFTSLVFDQRTAMNTLIKEHLFWAQTLQCRLCTRIIRTILCNPDLGLALTWIRFSWINAIIRHWMRLLSKYFDIGRDLYRLLLFTKFRTLHLMWIKIASSFKQTMNEKKMKKIWRKKLKRTEAISSFVSIHCDWINWTA